MATKEFVYLTIQEAVKFHVLYMRKLGETRFGVFDRNLIESALARPLSSRNLRKRRHHSPIRDASLWLNQKSSVGRRKQTHRNIFNQSVFEKKRLAIRTDYF